MSLAALSRDAYLPHRTTDLDVIGLADSIIARAHRIKRIAQPSATLPTRRQARDELKAIIKDARALLVML